MAVWAAGKMTRVWSMAAAILFIMLYFGEVEAEDGIPIIGTRTDYDYEYLQKLLENEFPNNFTVVKIQSDFHTTYSALEADLEKVLKLNLTATIGPHNLLFRILATEFGIPFYRVNEKAQTSYQNIFDMSINDVSLQQAYADVVDYYGKGESIALITDNSTRPDLFLQIFAGRPIRIATVQEEMNSEQMKDFLESVKTTSQKHAYIIILDTKNRKYVKEIFDNALYMSMMPSGSFWVIPDLTTVNALPVPLPGNSTSNSTSNSTTAAPSSTPIPPPEEFTGSMQELVQLIENNPSKPTPFKDPADIIAMSRTSARIRIFSLVNETIMDTDTFYNALLHDAVKHILASYNSSSNATMTEKVANTWVTGYTVTVRFNEARVRANLSLNVLGAFEDTHSDYKLGITGVWTQGQVPYSFYYNHNGNLKLKDQILRIGAVMDRPQIRKTANNDYIGMSIDILKLLSEELGFKFKIVEIEDGEFGSLNKTTGKWNGLMGALQRNEIDMTANLLTSTPDHEKADNFAIASPTILDNGYNILALTDKNETFEFTKLLTPFSWFVWVAIVITGLLMTTVLWLTDKISPNSDDRSPMFTFGDAGFLVFGSFVMAKMETNPRKPSARIFTFLLWLGSILFVASYAATLTAFLVKPYTSLPFNNIETLWNNQDTIYGYKYIFEKGQKRKNNTKNDNKKSNFFFFKTF